MYCVNHRVLGGCYTELLWQWITDTEVDITRSGNSEKDDQGPFWWKRWYAVKC